MPEVLGGQGLPVVGMAAVYEELGRSRFGPVAANCAAPDDGNMLVLERVGSEAQKAHRRGFGWSTGHSTEVLI